MSSINITGRGYFLAFFGLFIIALFPFAFCSPLPLADYSNHMARMHILANLENSADLAKYYALDWSFVPNLAMDILVPPLIPLMSTESATILFTAMTLLLMASGAIVLHRVLYGRVTLLPFAAFLLLYNRQFIWGFLNYLFSVGLALWIFSAHIYLRNRLNPPTRILAFSILSIILLVSHLHAFASYAILVGCFEISISWRAYRNTGNFRVSALAVPAIQFVLPTVIFFALSRTAERAGDTDFGGWQNKVIGLVDIFNNYVPIFDAATFMIVGALLAVGFYTKRLHIHPDMRLAISVLFGLYLILPSQLFSSYGADRRLLVMVALVLFASIKIRLENKLTARALVLAVGLLFVTRMGIISSEWGKANEIYTPILASIEKIEEGSRVAAIAGGEISPSLQNPPLDHIANMAVVKKNVLINSLFAEPGQQVLRIKNPASKDFAISPSQTRRAYGHQAGKVDAFEGVPLEKFDYVLLINPRFFSPERPPQLQAVFNDKNVSLYRNVDQILKAAPQTAPH